GKGCKVYLTFEQALEVIERLDRITCGAPKIVYLVGWQFNGHDSKYPAWSEVNHRLKRAQDPTALESLKWLMREGRKHHTTVSLHINALDAYEDSPLWQEYVDKDIIAKGKSLRYFRDYGLDVTSEHSAGGKLDAFVGLQSMAWIYEPAPDVPPSLYCGTPMKAESEIGTDPQRLPGLLEQFCLKAAPEIW